jgi:hypothetical protein
MYLTHLEIRIWRGSFHTLKNGFFGLQNSVVQGKAQGNFFFNFEHYDLANGEE